MDKSIRLLESLSRHISELTTKWPILHCWRALHLLVSNNRQLITMPELFYPSVLYSCRRQWTQTSLESQSPKTKMPKSNKLLRFWQCKYYLNKFALSEFKLQLFLYVTWIGSRNPNTYSWNQWLIRNTDGAEKHKVAKSSNKEWILNISGFQMTFTRYIGSLNLYPHCVRSWVFGLPVSLLHFLFSLLRMFLKLLNWMTVQQRNNKLACPWGEE